MLIALALAGVATLPGASPGGAPHQGWLLAAWPEDAPVDLEARSLPELLAERTRLREGLRSYAPGVALTVTGAVLTPLGALTALTGLLIAGALFSSQTALGVGLLIGGGAACLGGIALLIVGGALRRSAGEANEASERQLENLEREIERKEKAPPPPPPQVSHPRSQHGLAPA